MNNNKYAVTPVCLRNGAMPWINNVTDSLMGSKPSNITRLLAEKQKHIRQRMLSVEHKMK